MPVGSKHLRNGILKQHAFVDSKLPSKNLFIDFVLQSSFSSKAWLTSNPVSPK